MHVIFLSVCETGRRWPAAAAAVSSTPTTLRGTQPACDIQQCSGTQTDLEFSLDNGLIKVDRLVLWAGARFSQHESELASRCTVHREWKAAGNSRHEPTDIVSLESTVKRSPPIENCRQADTRSIDRLREWSSVFRHPQHLYIMLRKELRAAEAHVDVLETYIISALCKTSDRLSGTALHLDFLQTACRCRCGVGQFARCCHEQRSRIRDFSWSEHEYVSDRQTDI